MVIFCRQNGTVARVADRDAVAGLVADKTNLIWVDMERPTDEDVAWLGRTFGFHDLALEDAYKQRQRAKIETFEDHFFVVAHAAKPTAARTHDLTELHFFVGPNYVVDVRREPFRPIEELAAAAAESRYLKRGPDFLFYYLMDAAVDTYFPAMEKIDDAIDKLDRKVLERPGREDVEQIFKIKKQLVFWRKHISPQRDVVNALVSRDFPIITSDTVLYFRDIYDHLMRLYDDIDFSRDQLISELDIYLSQVSNNLNEVMKRLTVFASIFMPITFLTGFFGMNFGYIQDRSPWWWPVVALMMLAVAVMNYLWFKRRKWL